MGQSYTAPRTPWGDPDLQGTYTNSNESGISMEKPAEFAGKRVEEVTPAQLARADQDAARAAAEDRADDRRLGGERHRRRSPALVRELQRDEQPRVDDLRSRGRQDPGDD